MVARAGYRNWGWGQVMQSMSPVEMWIISWSDTMYQEGQITMTMAICRIPLCLLRKTWYHPRPKWNKRVRSLKKLPLRQGFHRWTSDQISDLQVLEGLCNFLNVAYRWGNDYFVYLGMLSHYGTILWHRVIWTKGGKDVMYCVTSNVVCESITYILWN